jgi:hypothetical protein
MARKLRLVTLTGGGPLNGQTIVPNPGTVDVDCTAEGWHTGPLGRYVPHTDTVWRWTPAAG